MRRSGATLADDHSKPGRHPGKPEPELKLKPKPKFKPESEPELELSTGLQGV